MKQGETNQDAEKEVQQILNQIRMRGEQIQ